jgi:biopolymer transport protein ExbD
MTMAEVPGGEGGGGGRHQKKRAKKGRTHIDMTPMVDLAFLLLTFFILTTTMYKPSTLQLTFPVPPEDDKPKELDKVNNALTLFLTKKDQILYYRDAYKTGETQLTQTNFKDIRKLLIVLQRLVDGGNSVLVIEHNLDVIKSADWVIDLGPEGGDGGGRILAEGTPEDVALVKGSYTGKYLKHVLEKGRRQRVGVRIAG